MKFRHIPLYKQISTGLVAVDNESDRINPVLYIDSNYGLLFDKFFDAYDENFTPLKENEYEEAVNHKLLFLKDFLYRYDYDNEQVVQSFSNYEKDLKNLKQSHHTELKRLEDRLRRANGRNNPNSSLITDIEKLESNIVLDTQHQESLEQLREQQQNRCATTNTKLADHREKHQNLIGTLEGQSKIYQLDGHFVTGMGNSHPVENGFLWHHTLGTPYLSGSMVKGLVRALIELYYDEADKQKKKEILYQWFGSDDKDPKKATRDSQAGELIFFDALPTKKPELSVDIMTPHMGDWYAEGGKISDVKKDSDKIPADWHDPKPIPFLAVKNAGFLFSIAKRRPDSDINIGEVFEFLDKALTYLGAGAKTQTGYGYMSSDENNNKKLNAKLADIKKQNEMEKLTPNQIEVVELFDELEKSQPIPVNDNRFNEFYKKISSLYKKAEEWHQTEYTLLFDKLPFNYIEGKLHFSKNKKGREKKGKLRELVGGVKLKLKFELND